MADTGLRVHEACSLLRGDLNLDSRQVTIIGKGDKEAVVRFSKQSIASIRRYLRVRQEIDGATGKPLNTLPLFSRHDIAGHKKVRSISTNTGREIVNKAVVTVLGQEALKTIIANLWIGKQTDTPINYSRNKNKWVRNSRYGKLFFTYKRFIPVLFYSFNN